MAGSGQDNDDQVEEGGAPRPGWRHRLNSAVSRPLIRPVDGGIALLQKLRAALAPQAPTEVEAVAAEPTPVEVPRGRPLLMFLIGTMMLLVGSIVGAVFSFGLFAQKIESQGDLIANQADEVFEYGKDARRAERALENAKSELKDARQALEAGQTELQQAKIRLAELEGKALLYGSKGGAPVSANAADPVASASDALATMRGAASASRQGAIRQGSCDLGSASASRDLSRCLNGR